MRLPFQRHTDRAAARGSSKPLRSDAFLRRAMDAWGDTVLRVALAQTGSPSDADDVFQDVFMRLLENDTAFENDEHLKAWLLRVTINRCRPTCAPWCTCSTSKATPPKRSRPSWSANPAPCGPASTEPASN